MFAGCTSVVLFGSYIRCNEHKVPYSVIYHVDYNAEMEKGGFGGGEAE